MRRTVTVPEVGMEATICIGTTRHPVRVVEVRLFKSGTRKGEPRQVDVQFEDSPEGPVRSFLWNARGYWREKGAGRYGSLLLLGKRERYTNHESPTLLIMEGSR